MWSKIKIVEYLRDKKLEFTPPLDQFQLQPNSVDLRLGTTFYIPEIAHITDAGREGIRADYIDVTSNPEYFKMVKLKPGQYFEILPGEFIIISTLEKITMRTGDYGAMLYPRSSVLRRGLLIEGGVVDACYDGYLTIPTLNSSKHVIRLYPGERFCHLVFHTLTETLTNDEAQVHGVNAAKYHSATQYGLDARLDRQEELDKIKSGNLDGLKASHPIVMGSKESSHV